MKDVLESVDTSNPIDFIKEILTHFLYVYTCKASATCFASVSTGMAWTGLICADVPLINYSLTHFSLKNDDMSEHTEVFNMST